MPDVVRVFKDPATAATRERVIKYLFPLFDKYSDLPVEIVWSNSLISEEIFIPMPTVSAFHAEVELCNGILEHAAGQIGDTAMQSVIKHFLDAHIWIYHPDGPRTNKVGSWPDWARVKLYNLFFKNAAGVEKCEVVNAIQAWLVRLLEEQRGSTGFVVKAI